MTDEMTGFELFAGIGGIGLAMEQAGIRVTGACEIDKQARGVYADRFPDTVLFEDVKELTADDILETGFDPDNGILTAGFPCQDLSVAGRRAGMGEGTRSGLWWEIDRLLRELQPCWFVGENVPGLLTAHAGDGVRGSAMGAVLGTLGECGYGYAYRVLDAQFFGVPQRRRRVVIVGHLGDVRRPVEVLLEPQGGTGDSAQGDTARPEAAADLGYGLAVTGTRGGVANTLTARDAKGPLPDQSLGTVIVEQPVISTLQGGGRRGYRVDAEAAGGGHLVVTRRSGTNHHDGS